MTGRTCSFAKLFVFKSDTPIADRDVILNVYLHEVLENIEIWCQLLPYRCLFY